MTDYASLRHAFRWNSELIPQWGIVCHDLQRAVNNFRQWNTTTMTKILTSDQRQYSSIIPKFPLTGFQRWSWFKPRKKQLRYDMHAPLCVSHVKCLMQNVTYMQHLMRKMLHVTSQTTCPWQYNLRPSLELSYFTPDGTCPSERIA